MAFIFIYEYSRHREITIPINLPLPQHTHTVYRKKERTKRNSINQQLRVTRTFVGDKNVLTKSIMITCTLNMASHCTMTSGANQLFQDDPPVVRLWNRRIKICFQFSSHWL